MPITLLNSFFIYSILRSVDLSTSNDQKQFQELLLERTKALAQAQAQVHQQQNDAIKSSNSDGMYLT